MMLDQIVPLFLLASVFFLIYLHKRLKMLKKEGGGYISLTFIKTAILLGYLTLLFFTIALFFMILSTIAPLLLYTIVILLICGCSSFAISVVLPLIEMSYEITHRN